MLKKEKISLIDTEEIRFLATRNFDRKEQASNRKDASFKNPAKFTFEVLYMPKYYDVLVGTDIDNTEFRFEIKSIDKHNYVLTFHSFTQKYRIEMGINGIEKFILNMVNFLINIILGDTKINMAIPGTEYIGNKDMYEYEDRFGYIINAEYEIINDSREIFTINYYNNDYVYHDDNYYNNDEYSEDNDYYFYTYSESKEFIGVMFNTIKRFIETNISMYFIETSRKYIAGAKVIENYLKE